MQNIFFISDTHFGHANILKFIVHRPECSYHDVTGATDTTVQCGCPRMREFASVEEMNEHIIAQWNRVVGVHDKTYHLGDVAIDERAIPLIARCNGTKNLVRGNHDIAKLKKYLPYFKQIYGMRVLNKEGLVLTHAPIHPESLRRNWSNVHGHVHNNVSALHFGPRYLNVCVEMTEYRPLELSEIRERLKAQRDENQQAVNDNLRRLGITPWDDGLDAYV